MDLPAPRVASRVGTELHLASDAAKHILDMARRPGDGIPYILSVDHGPKFANSLFREFTRRVGRTLIVHSAFGKNRKITNGKLVRFIGVLGDTLRAYANGLNVDWDVWLSYAMFTVNNSASTLGGDVTPFFIDRGAHPRLPLRLSLPDLYNAGESPSACIARMNE